LWILVQLSTVNRCVGHRVFVAGNELVAVEQLLESIETTPDHAQLDLLHFRRQVRVEERADLLVYFGRCEVQREKAMSWAEVTVKAVNNSDEVAFCSSSSAS